MLFESADVAMRTSASCFPGQEVSLQEEGAGDALLLGQRCILGLDDKYPLMEEEHTLSFLDDNN